MAWRAGARVSNMEMMQFHPTCLYNLEVKNFLITEAVRGEGGQLKQPGYRARASCPTTTRAPSSRRATSSPAQSTTRSSASASITSISTSATCRPSSCSEHFPTIYEKLLGLGIDMTKEPIPVVPAQHYTCGGILIDLNGQDRPAGALCGGECTESGLHGANRLASNSLLECFVFGEAAARDILERWRKLDAPPPIREPGTKAG